MNILFLSNTGCSSSLAIACQDQGHKVRLHIKYKDSKDVADGFVEKIDDYEGSLKWAQLVITDDTISFFGKLSDSLRDQGLPVIGGTKMTDALEDDRGAGQKLFKAVGFNILESNDFKTIEEAVMFVQENPGRYVVKCSGKAQEDKMTTYVGESDDGFDIIPVLEHMGDKMKKLETVQIQKHVIGIEVAIGGFFNGKKFIGPCFANFEHKKIMSWKTQSGMGPNTGEMGTVGFWMDQDIELFKKILRPMVAPLSKMGYHGYFDINCIVVEEEGKPVIYPLEMTNRFGWPTLPLQVETLKDIDLGEFFMALAKGEDFEVAPSHPVSLCLVIGVPPLPYENKEIFERYSKGLPILFVEGPSTGMHAYESKMEDGVWKVAGEFGYLMVCAAGGHSVKECQTAAYALADDVIVPNKMVRDDIGRLTEKAFRDLERFGLLSASKEF